MKKRVIAVIISAVFVVTGCDYGTSAEELTKYYAEQAAKEAAEKAKEEAAEAASKINQAIDENETASKVKKGVTTAGEHAQDAYEYAKDENTISSAKETAKEVEADSKNFIDYMLKKLEKQWYEVVENIEKGPAGATSSPYGNTEEDLKNASEYDFFGNYQNPFKEAKGIDTTNDGTAMEQLKDAFGNLSKATKETVDNIKQYHDERHPVTEDTTEHIATSDLAVEVQVINTGSLTQDISDALLPQIPEFDGSPYCIVNDNVPFFEEPELSQGEFITLSELDSLGRCGVAYMCAGPNTVAKEERGEIGMIKPSGFEGNQAKYDILKDSEDNPAGYLLCRCHLLAHTLSALSAEPRNLISGTFFFNVQGMEQLELATSYYIKSTGNRVLYRVTPLYASATDLMSRGVLMEIQSIEDNSLRYCVFVYNVAPGINIDYATGKSSLAE